MHPPAGSTHATAQQDPRVRPLTALKMRQTPRIPAMACRRRNTARASARLLAAVPCERTRAMPPVTSHVARRVLHTHAASRARHDKACVAPCLLHVQALRVQHKAGNAKQADLSRRGGRVQGEQDQSHAERVHIMICSFPAARISYRPRLSPPLAPNQPHHKPIRKEWPTSARERASATELIECRNDRREHSAATTEKSRVP